MNTGELIRAHRKSRYMTQEDLALKCDTSAAMIRQYELCKRNPKIETLQRIANALDVSLSELINVPLNSNLQDILDAFPSATIENGDGKERIKLMNAAELQQYFRLNSKGKEKVLSYISDLAKLPEYTDDESPAE